MEREVAAVPEEVVRLRVNGAPVATWSCTPRALEALAAGRLLAHGFIRSADDLHALDVSPADDPGGGVTIRARVAAAGVTAAAEEREHRRAHGCGLRFLVTCRPDLLPVRPPGSPEPEAAAFPELFRALFDRSPSRDTTGGHHTVALVGPDGLLHVHEEVGRHNGVDKAIGGAILARDPLPRLGLLTTARISGEIAEKCARAGLAWVASRSVPTSLAVEIAGAAGLPILARAARPEARLFRPAQPAAGGGAAPPAAADDHAT